MKSSSGLKKNLATVGILTLCVAAFVLCSVLVREKSPEGDGRRAGPPAPLLVTYYTKCGCLVGERVDEPGDRDKSFPAEADIRDGTGKSKDAAFSFRTVDDYCPEHARTRFITLKDGVVVVYRGHTADDRFLVQTFANLKEELMTSETREDLSAGFLIEDDPDLVDGQVELLLEGIID